MPPPYIDELPPAPLRSEDPFTFSAKAEAWVAAIADWTAQANALGAYLLDLVGAATYSFGFFFTAPPTESEVLLLHVAGHGFTIAGGFTGALEASVGANPVATVNLDVRVNGASIGTISIADDGMVTATTLGNAPQVVAKGDLVAIVAPPGPDPTLANCAFTIIGAR